jgi:hypothetical protein
VSKSPLSTHAGPIAVIAGGLFAVAHVGQFLVMDRSNLVTMMLNPAFGCSAPRSPSPSR